MYNLSAFELREIFVTGQVSAKEIANYFIHRIEAFNPQLGSFLTILSERVLKKAESLDNKRKDNKPLGKLAGVPIAIKDNMHIKGQITTCGSKFLENYKAPFDATAVHYLEQEDALLIGKTNLDEFAMGSSNEFSAYMPTHNPWNLDCSPGGSSGGSAAAVGARLVPLATGSDTGGSIRQPAAFCGIVGFKPTYGRVSRYGLVAFGSSLDQIGPLATSVRGAGLMMESMGKICRRDSTSLPFPPENYLEELPTNLKGIRVGIPWHFLEGLSEDVENNFKSVVEKLKELGAETIDINLDILKYSIAVYYILAPAEAATNLARFDGIRYGARSQKAKTLDEVYDMSREEGFGPEVKKRIMLGTYVLSSGYQDEFYRKAQKVRTLIIRSFEDAFDQCDFVAMPSCPSSAFELGSIRDPVKMYQQDLFTISANLAGLPAISIPSGFNYEQKPLGVQFLGPQLHDVNVIRYAYAFEQATKEWRKVPPLFDKEAP